MLLYKTEKMHLFDYELKKNSIHVFAMLCYIAFSSLLFTITV